MEINVFLVVNGEWGGRWFASAPKNCRRRGASVGTSLERWRRWRRGEKKQKVRAYSACGTFWHHGVDCHTLLTGGASAWMRDGKSYVALPVCNKASHHYRQQKALFEPQTQRCAKGRGLCQGTRRTRGGWGKVGQTYLQNNTCHWDVLLWEIYFERWNRKYVFSFADM